MNFLCDVHISFSLVRYLTSRNHSVIHVNHLPKKWFTPDNEISDYADSNNYVLITKDSDFRKSFLLKKTPKKMIRVVLGNISNEELIKIFIKHETTLTENLKREFCYIELSASDVLLIESV
jgi:predicted nuclease of predicted toxin-antitoxin system